MAKFGEEVVLGAGAVGAGIGMALTMALSAPSLKRALYATADQSVVTRIEGILKNNGIPFNTTSPTLDPNTVRLLGPNNTTLFVIVIEQGNFDKASALIKG